MRRRRQAPTGNSYKMSDGTWHRQTPLATTHNVVTATGVRTIGTPRPTVG